MSAVSSAARRYDLIVAAGEASGDRLGARLVNDLRRWRPSLRVAGVGGANMWAAGVEKIADCQDLAVMGYWDVLGRLPAILRIRRRLLELLRTSRPPLFVGIDAPDFNLGVARRARQWGIGTVQYVSPSVWMWRQNRLAAISRAVDEVWCLFPFELASYAACDVVARFVGYPDACRPIFAKAAAQAHLGLSATRRTVALFPGSRAAELRLHLPLFAEVMAHLRDEEVDFIAAAVDDKAAQQMRAFLPGVRIWTGDKAAFDVLSAAEVALLKSGTSTLQAALADTPMVVVYRVSAVAYWLAARRAFRLPFFALPNILAGRFAVPEFIQQEAAAATVAAALRQLLHDGSRQQQRRYFADIRQSLAAAGQTAAAEAAMMMLEARK